MPLPLAEYLVSLGFRLDTPGAKRFVETLDFTAKSFVKLTETAVAANVAVGLAVEKIATNYQDLFFLSQRTGATIQSLQATAYGFTQIGLSADDAKGMVDSLAMSLKVNPGNNVLLRMLGIGPGDANTQLHQLMEKLSLMPFNVAAIYGARFGISPFQLTQYENNRAELQIATDDKIRRLRDAGIETKKLGDESNKFIIDLHQMEDEFDVLGTKIGQDWIEPADKVIQQLETWLEELLQVDKATNGWVTTIGSVVVAFGALRAAGMALSGVAGMFGFGAGTKAVIGGATGAGWGGLIAALLRPGRLPMALGALLLMKHDAEHGNVLRSRIRRSVGLPDEHEPSRWAKPSPYGDMSDVPFGNTGVDLSAAAKAIGSIEGNYNSIGPATRTGDHAFGRYQVMGANIGAWTERFYGQRLTPEEFLANKAAQDAVFRGQFGVYASKYGREGAARAWFAGEGGMNNPNARDALGTTVHGYENRFRMEYDAAVGSDATPSGGTTTLGAPQTTINVHGGADPQTTADYVLKGQSGLWADYLRNAGANAR
jgi:hypothetical protein